MPGWLRSVLAVAAGAVAIVILHTGTDALLERTGLFPPPQSGQALDPVFLGTALVYRNLFNVLGGALTGRLAPGHPQGHAAALGAIGLVLNAAAAVVLWDMGAHWYPIALAVLALPATWLGGWLVARRG